MTAQISRAPNEGRNETDEGNGATAVLVGAGLVGAAVALSLSVYGRSHTPTGLAISPIDPSDMLLVKSSLTTLAAGLAIAQLVTALWMYGRLPGAPSAPGWVGPTHRWTGTVAFLVSLPVAYHCLWSIGFQDYSTRVLLHSLFGCAFYGALSTKLLLLRSSRLPGWALPIAGGSLVTLLVAIWLTSAFWFFTDIDLFAAIQP